MKLEIDESTVVIRYLLDGACRIGITRDACASGIFSGLYYIHIDWKSQLKVTLRVPNQY